MIPRAYRTESRHVAPPADPVRARVDALLPSPYHDPRAVSVNSMGSAGLVRDADGQIAWGRIWTSFCDLALAGGPPHRGRWLAPVGHATPGATLDAVTAELARAVRLVTGRVAELADDSHAVRVPCDSSGMARWLALAVVAENVYCEVTPDGRALQFLASPEFRFEREVKNQVCALAKALHYYEGHLTPAQQSHAETLELVAPPRVADAVVQARLAEALAAMGLTPAADPAPGWAGVVAPDEHQAALGVRVLASAGVTARREARAVFLPAGAGADRVALAASELPREFFRG